MALVGKNSEKNNQNLMQLIRRAHGLVENPDLEKHRQSQDHIGELLGNSKEIQYRPVDIDGMDAEWVSVNRAHMKKYVILHCHGGGYSTGRSTEPFHIKPPSIFSLQTDTSSHIRCSPHSSRCSPFLPFYLSKGSGQPEIQHPLPKEIPK